MFEPGDMYEYKMNTKPKHSYSLLFLFFKDLFFQCMDMFANSDSGGDEVPDGADDEAKDPHGRGAVHEHDHWRGTESSACLHSETTPEHFYTTQFPQIYLWRCWHPVTNSPVKFYRNAVVRDSRAHMAKVHAAIFSSNLRRL